jgi:hypothetical protein
VYCRIEAKGASRLAGLVIIVFEMAAILNCLSLIVFSQARLHRKYKFQTTNPLHLKEKLPIVSETKPQKCEYLTPPASEKRVIAVLAIMTEQPPARLKQMIFLEGSE